MPRFFPAHRRSLEHKYVYGYETRKPAGARPCPRRSGELAPCGVALRYLLVYSPCLILNAYFPPAEPTALPALRLINSSRYLMPLPLYGSGGLSARIFAAVSPNSCRSALFKVMIIWRSTDAVTPSGSGKTTG